MRSSSSIGVLLVDDHPVVRAGMAALLEIDPEENIRVVGEAGNGHQAIERFEELRPDVTLMDLRMPELDGVEAIRAICTRHPQARIIVLTTFDGDEDITLALRAGASGYLLKDSPREQLLQAVRSVAGGGRFVPPEVASRLTARDNFESLSPREAELLQIIAEGKSNREIANELFITEGTVKFHINRILTKLGASNRSEAVAIALRRGLVRKK
ncbi:transcriptional regulatory protein LiaR [Abditibacteriota bacterium]|nr:transcriptional regulatory protein LiaR [Abditibacteriota bacterium]